MAKTIFNLLNDMAYTKVGWDELSDADQKQFNGYMVNRFFSMDMNLIEIVNEVQVYTGQLSDKQLYSVYTDILPKRKFFAKYVNVKRSEHYEMLVEFFMDNLKLSAADVECLISRSTKNQIIEEINAHTGLTDKEIIKKYKL